MPRYAAFLRAINVTNRFVKMAELRKVFESFGYENVETYIQSGNIIFDSPQEDARGLEKEIEAQLEAALGFAVPTFLRSGSELAQVANTWPFSEADRDERATLYVSFIRAEPPLDLQEKLAALSNEIDQFHVHGPHVYWLYRRYLSRSNTRTDPIEKTLQTLATNRNISTVRKITAKYFPNH
jgi:uncharacterized protein (DUF1697 family)